MRIQNSHPVNVMLPSNHNHLRNQPDQSESVTNSRKMTLAGVMRSSIWMKYQRGLKVMNIISSDVKNLGNGKRNANAIRLTQAMMKACTKLLS